jgi:hypothetical protein
VIDGISDSNGAGSARLGRFTLPQICSCGAQGKITFEPRPLRPGKPDPHPAIVNAEGPFHIDSGDALICLGCGERLDRQSN